MSCSSFDCAPPHFLVHICIVESTQLPKVHTIGFADVRVYTYYMICDMYIPSYLHVLHDYEEGLTGRSARVCMIGAHWHHCHMTALVNQQSSS